MTKVANSLSAKMEMGSPMICMYLLGNPDHYKSHQFRVFYWQSFVNEHKDRVIGISPLHDYIYRPEELVDMSLYDWIARCERCKIPVKKNSKRVRTDKNADVTNSLYLDDGHDHPPNYSKLNASSRHLYRLMPEHPLAETHGIRCCPPDKEKVPNFVGTTLPRFDQGDREYYCCTMLTIFKPWRSGVDLKRPDQDWDCAFSTHRFSSRHREILDNMNIRYECLDAKDDFQAQMRKGGVGIGSWEDIDAEV
ncbi:hypothetical protein BC826DRAFT_883168, partial [Russula brevipes]